MAKARIVPSPYVCVCVCVCVLTLPIDLRDRSYARTVPSPYVHLSKFSLKILIDLLAILLNVPPIGTLPQLATMSSYHPYIYKGDKRTW